ncbi:DUF4271 domain-containing protein [Cyclobacterium jeungdonense]|uniref:DUF4271 domain-containing protein n=1 Tax=Cyclobacterium jeungdonense TaxID=708087 RepID=A0ABT8C5F4_9BACT|nr:DUF4271 domain-containing protein [Cyclobacterium jeungdonense]MDN3687956.1 DUF4271 domain-containing protein [Cyclobacterium jeungdonense]
MKRSFQLFLVLVFLCIFQGRATLGTAQVLLNYDPDIQLQKQGFSLAPNEAAFVWVEPSSFPAATWRIAVPSEAGLFIGEELWMIADRDTLLFFESNVLESSSDSNGKVKITARKQGIDLGEFSVKKGFFGSPAEIPRTSDRQLSKREKDEVREFFFIAIVVLLFFIALFRLLFPSIFGIFWNPAGIFAFDDLWESVSFSKIYSAELLFYLIVINLGVGLMTLLGIHLFEIELFGLLFEKDIRTMIYLWLVISLVLTLLTFFKFLWLGMHTFIFDLHKVALPHFFYLLKVSGFGLLMVLGLTVVFYANHLIPGAIDLEILYYSFLGVYTLGIMGLSIWMYKKNGFNNYHLFSYLCTSELIPFLVICKLLLG